MSSYLITKQFPRLEDVKGPKDIIMDLKDSILLTYEITKEMQEVEMSLNESIDLMVEYINDNTQAESGLERFIDSSNQDHHRVGCPEDGVLMAKALKILGDDIIGQFRFHNLYHSSGFAFYDFDGWADSFSPRFTKSAERIVPY